MKSRKEELIENISEYLKAETEGYKDCCGEDDEINYLPAKKALDESLDLKEILKSRA